MILSQPTAALILVLLAGGSNVLRDVLLLLVFLVGVAYLTFAGLVIGSAVLAVILTYAKADGNG